MADETAEIISIEMYTEGDKPLYFEEENIVYYKVLTTEGYVDAQLRWDADNGDAWDNGIPGQINVSPDGDGPMTVYARAENGVQSYKTFEVIAEVKAITLWTYDDAYKGAWGEVLYDIYPYEATNKTLVWSSTENITIEDRGVPGRISFLPTDVGRGTISATSVNGITVSRDVAIDYLHPTHIFLPKKVYVELGKDYQLDVELYPAESDRIFLCSSKDERIAKINDDAVITPVSIGSTVVEVECIGNLKAECVVTVVQKLPAEISLDYEERVIALDGEAVLKTTLLPENSYPLIEWSSKNKDVATVTDGVVKPLKLGKTQITASTVNGLTAVCAITVSIISIEMDKTSIDLNIGEITNLKAVVEPYTADQTVTWHSGREDVATVESGLVTALKQGTSVITAENAYGGKAQCALTVSQEQESGVSNAFRDAIKNNRRGKWDAFVMVDTAVIPRKNIKKITLHELMFSDNKITLGSVVNNYVEIEFINTSLSLLNRSIEFKIGMEVNGVYEYISFGKFYVTEVTGNTGEEIRKVTAFDSAKKLNKKYKTQLYYPATLTEIVEEIAQQCGLEIETSKIPKWIKIPKKFNKKKCRDVLGEIGKLVGCSVVANRESKIEFRLVNYLNYVIDKNKYYSLDVSEKKSVIDSVSGTIQGEDYLVSFIFPEGEENTYNKLSLTYDNPYTSNAAYKIVNGLVGISYLSGEVKFIGDPTLRAGDCVYVDNGKEKTRFVIMENTIEYDGGVRNTCVSYAETEESKDINGSGALTTDKLEEQALKAESVDWLPVTPDDNTIYFIRDLRGL